jgi:hypothetical protein
MQPNMKKSGKKGIASQLLARTNVETPGFFKKLRIIGLALTAAGAALVTAPITLPVMVVTIGGYLTVAGSVLGAVSQLTVKNETRFEKFMSTSKTE